MSQDTIFNNPFEDINANVMEPKKILNFWCDPFASGFLTEINEKEFYTKKIPIILEGSRGSGKTTLLKYFSSDVQFELAGNRKDRSYTKQVQSDGGVGIYFRCDEAFIKTFQIIFSIKDKKSWIRVFEHYLELFIVKNIFEIIKKMDNYESFESDIMEELKIKKNLKFSGFQEFEQYISSEIAYIDSYKNIAIFTGEEFLPENVFSLYQISRIVIECLKKTEPLWKNINFLILIDEFENLDFELQKMFNTLLKFSTGGISFRIGRRSEGLITAETVNQYEYLRKNHDYHLISLIKDAKHEITKKYFEEIAKKRFECFPEFKGVDISQILGTSEDFDWEAKKLAKNETKHMLEILKTNQILNNDEEVLNQVINTISYPENPIAEMLNALWVIRDKNKDKLEVAEDVKKIMMLTLVNKNQKISDNEAQKIKKYSSDYRNKYRYSLVLLMSSIYKKKKLYYSFNTICYLSNSNARMFMNFCRTIINDANFYERKEFIKIKRITEETQSRAIHEVSHEEFNNVRAIINHGQKIGNLVQNIGSVFTDFHKDRRVRYPETNQFIFELSQLRDDYKDILNIALSWSVIVERPNKQRGSAGFDKKVSIYYLNRTYAPIFNISYRTRGGVNVDFTPQEIQDMCETQMNIYKIDKNRDEKNIEDTSVYEQIDLFNSENIDE